MDALETLMNQASLSLPKTERANVEALLETRQQLATVSAQHDEASAKLKQVQEAHDHLETILTCSICLMGTE